MYAQDKVKYYYKIEGENKKMDKVVYKHDVFVESPDWMNESVNEIIRKQAKYTERALIEIIDKYDFIVGSKETKRKLMELLPEGVNIVCSPYIKHPTMVYAVEKFDIMDLLS